MELSRRSFLTNLVTIPALTSAGLWIPGVSYGQDAAPRTWTLWLQRQDTGEEYRETYVENNELLIPGYNRVCHALRDSGAPNGRQVVQIDLRLLNLMFSVQQWLRINKKERPLVVLSGYRTIEKNARTENAALDSMHIHGRACDFRIEGLPTRTLGDLVKWFQAGGVGFYAESRFIHMDTGKPRTWSY